MDKSAVSKKLGALSALQKFLIFLVLTLAVYGGYWYFILDDKLIQIAKAKQEIEKLDKDIAMFRAQVANLPELRRSLELRKKELYYAKTLLPEDATGAGNAPVLLPSSSGVMKTWNSSCSSPEPSRFMSSTPPEASSCRSAAPSIVW